jgi:predicted AAA+ superfamily ATPase
MYNVLGNNMVLKRKIDHVLKAWKESKGHKPLLIAGIRQCGKTYAVKRFAKEEYENVIYINFMTNPDAKRIFSSSLEVNDLIPLLSITSPGTAIVPSKTVFIFDEIQDCPRARLSLKSFAEDGRFDVIATGSYLGIRGYGIGEGTPLPVGYEDIRVMRTMDFEEFLWANGYGDDQITYLRKAFETKTPLPEAAISIYSKLFRLYLCIGGFPEAVNIFVSSKNLQSALEKVKSISKELQSDFGRRLDKNLKPIFNQSEISRISKAYELIPSFLAKENKRYFVSKISSGNNGALKSDAISFLEDSGIIVRAFNLNCLSIPLSLEKKESEFKVFPSDIGLFVAGQSENISNQILLGDLGAGKGALYESLIADAFSKNGIPLYYFSKPSGLELDFVIGINGIATIVEVKAKNGNAKSAKTVLSNPDHYGKARLYKAIDGNISYENGIFSFPHFMAFLLQDSPIKNSEPVDYQSVKDILP